MPAKANAPIGQPRSPPWAAAGSGSVLSANPHLAPGDRYASFAWYDLPEIHAKTDALWSALARLLTAEGIRDVPLAIDRSRQHGIDPDGACFFTQTCGYPLFTTAREHFRVLGAPAYAVAGCSGSNHRSFITVRADAPATTLEDLRGKRFAINEADSNSGMNLPRRLIAPLARDGRFFGSTVLTGSHAASVAAVRAGAADAAAIDCVTFALLERYRPQAVRELRVIGETATSPTPPFVTAETTAPEVVGALLRALRTFANDRAYASIRASLFLADIVFCDLATYNVVMRYERESRTLGYPTLE